jgi:putative ABC transport system permease protein
VEGRIIGVVRDFNYETLRNDIEPIVTYIAGYVNTMAIRIAPGNYQKTIDYIKTVYAKYNPGATLEYAFLDDRLDALYKNEATMMELFGYFSVLALVIGCLGLFGLAAFTAEQKTKEIGIRKTLGASVGNIAFHLSYQFAQWIVIANLIAIPVIYMYMSDWLNNFAFRTHIELTFFLLSLAISLVIALVSVSTQIIKVALQNPVIALRTE